MLLHDIITIVKSLISIQLLAAVVLVYLLGFTIYNRYFHPYKDIPGPFLASITSLWYFRSVRYGIGENTQWPIHRKYGPIVRVTPNMVSISDPTAIETIYGPKNTFPKTSFYDGFNPKISPRPDGFCDRDEKRHAQRRRIVQPIYSQQQILSFEPHFDRIIKLFYQQMDRFSETGEVFDMALWLTKYTFDIVGELFYGREGGFGMIRDNTDYNDWCHLMQVMPAPASAVTYFPKGFQTLYLASQLLYKQSRQGLRGGLAVVRQAHAAVKERLEEMKKPEYKPRNDNLAILIDLVNKRGEELNWQICDVTTEIWMIIWAGSDTTAIALASIFWHLHEYPKTLTKLLDEIEDAFATGALTYPIRFNDAIKLRHLWAVVQEAMRIHPSVGTGLPRVVPPGGAEICGHYLPAGCHVLMNAKAVHFDKTMFGDDCHEFIPERWLRDGEKKAAEMERHMLQFGYGPRMCQGKHITNTEMYKLLPTILRDFRFEIVTEDWKPYATWFAHPKNVNVRVSRRRPAAPEASIG